MRDTQQTTLQSDKDSGKNESEINEMEWAGI